MTTFAVTDPNHTLGAINYLLSNLNTGGTGGNVTLPGNVLVANTTTGVVSQYGNTADVSYYLYQYVNLRYSNNSTGGSGSFSTVPANANYFGVFNSVSSAPSSNPTDYQWYQVSGGFGTDKYLFYSAIGGRQVQWAAANAAPSSNYVESVATVAIDLDVVTTATGTPGERGPIAMAYVITTADPTTATASQLTTWFEAPRDAVTAPIGTGLTPVVGDTALFTYVNGTTNPSACYSFNGSIWVPVDAQVVSGNVLVEGTVAANAIIAGSITSTQIAADTITANNIAAGTITSAKIAANTITANNIAGNTITATQIQTGTLTTNLFTANTIQGNIIAAGTITADQLAANAITANTVVSSGAILNNNASLGFWLDGPSGNARFGNSISIGNQLTVGTNASIGGNLTVAGLISSGSLDANTVITNNIIPNGVTNTARGQVGVVVLASGPVSGTTYTTPGATITTTEVNQTVVIYMNLGMQLQLTASGGSATRFGQLVTSLHRYDASAGGPGLTLQSTSKFFTIALPSAGSSSNVISVSQVYPTYVDTVASPGTYVYAFGGGVIYTTVFGTVGSTLRTYQESIDDTIFLNTISALGLKR